MKIEFIRVAVASGLDTNSGKYIDKTISFSGFTSVLAIIPVLSMYKTPSTATDYGYISAAVLSNTLTSATIRIFKAYGGYVYPEFDVYIIGSN